MMRSVSKSSTTAGFSSSLTAILIAVFTCLLSHAAGSSSIEGIVFDELAQKPLANCPVVATTTSDLKSEQPSLVRMGKTDAQGKYEISGLLPFKRYMLTLEMDGCIYVPKSVMSPQPEETRLVPKMSAIAGITLPLGAQQMSRGCMSAMTPSGEFRMLNRVEFPTLHELYLVGLGMGSGDLIIVPGANVGGRFVPSGKGNAHPWKKIFFPRSNLDGKNVAIYRSTSTLKPGVYALQVYSDVYLPFVYSSPESDRVKDKTAANTSDFWRLTAGGDYDGAFKYIAADNADGVDTAQAWGNRFQQFSLLFGIDGGLNKEVSVSQISYDADTGLTTAAYFLPLPPRGSPRGSALRKTIVWNKEGKIAALNFSHMPGLTKPAMPLVISHSFDSSSSEVGDMVVETGTHETDGKGNVERSLKEGAFTLDSMYPYDYWNAFDQQTPCSDFVLTGTISLTPRESGFDAGLILRWQPGMNYFACVLTSDQKVVVQERIFRGGSWFPGNVWSQPCESILVGAPNVLWVECAGGYTYRFWVNGEPAGEVQRDSAPLPSAIGIKCQKPGTATFDNILYFAKQFSIDDYGSVVKTQSYDGDSTFLAGPHAEDSHRWRVKNGALQAETIHGYGERWLTTDEVSLGDLLYSASIEIKDAEFAPEGLIFRFVDNDNFYLAKMDDHRVSIAKRVKGEWKNIVPNVNYHDVLGVEPGTKNVYRLSVLAKGPGIHVFIDNKYITGAVDTEFKTGGVGLFMGTSTSTWVSLRTFDDIEIRAE